MKRSSIGFVLLAVALASLIAIVFVPPASFAQSETVDYAQYEVLDVQEFDLYAAPGRSAAHLAPDGTRFVHIQGEDMCVYRLVETVWTQAFCFVIDARALRDSEEMFFSPDGRYLTLPTYAEALQMVLDTDVRVLDVETGQIINLTDDGWDNDFFDDAYNGFLDLAPRWIDDDTLAFIRYTELGPDRPTTLGLYTIDLPVDGAIPEPQRIIEIPLMSNVQTYIMGSDLLRGRLAFNNDLRSESLLQGIWQVNVDGSDLRLVQPIRDYQLLPFHLEYAADGNYLLSFSAAISRVYTTTAMTVVSIEDGVGIDIDPRFPQAVSGAGEQTQPQPYIVGAGWSPSGSALVYAVRDVLEPENAGLYITTTPGEPGRMILEGDYYGTTCCQLKPIAWAPNDVILIGRGSAPGVLLVRVGVP
jgi:hypothetical protein